MHLKNAYGIMKSALWDFVDDDAMTLGAALTFYTALSLAPLVLILLAITALLGPDLQEGIIEQIESAAGPQAGATIAEIIQQGQQEEKTGTLSALIGFAILAFSATGAFGQMQYSLNRIWEVQPKPGSGLWRWLRKRVLSLGMILALAFLLLVSLGLSTAINLLFAGTSGFVWEAVNFVASLLVYLALFALIYKVMPDVKIAWKDVWAGALITALLFTLGKFLLGLYLGRSTVASPYGSAGSLVVILLWVYYASLIFFFGAEITQTYVRFQGRPLQPDEDAERIPAAEKEELQEAASGRD